MANCEAATESQWKSRTLTSISAIVHGIGMRNSTTHGNRYNPKWMWVASFPSITPPVGKWHFILDQQAYRIANNDVGLAELLDFVDKSHSNADSAAMNDVSGSVYLPVASLMTGINKPDHHQYFKNLCDQLIRRNGTHTVVLPARDCSNVKSTIELLVSCVLCNGRKHNYRDEEEVNVCLTENRLLFNSRWLFQTHDNRSFLTDEESEPEADADEPPIKLRRSQYTMNVLRSWYSQRYPDRGSGTPKICVIIPNFEEFKPAVIVDLILILRWCLPFQRWVWQSPFIFLSLYLSLLHTHSHSNHCHELPFVLVLGVATTTASLFHTLSFTETTRIKLHAFSSTSPVGDLNRILDDIILSPRSAFHVSAKIFKYLTNVFMCYDLTANEFLRAYRFCMLAHYEQGAAYGVCASTCIRSMEIIKRMSGDQFERISHKQIEQIRRLPSFRPLVEGSKNPVHVIAMLTDDEYLMNALGPLVRDIYSYFMKFHCYMRVLLLLVKDLPQSPLGRHLRDIYPMCIGGNRSVVDTEEFQKCWQYLALMSKQEVAALLEQCCHMMHDYSVTYCSAGDSQVDGYVAEDARKCITNTIRDLTVFIESLKSTEQSNSNVSRSASASNDPQPAISRQEIKRKLMEKAQQHRLERNQGLKRIMDYLRDSMIDKYVLPSCKGPPLIELFVFSNHRSVQSRLKGAPRGAIHTALTNPQYYYQVSPLSTHTDESNQAIYEKSLPKV